MLKDALRAGFEDELRKIAEISLAGVSPESAVQHLGPAGPMETSGLAKANAILARYQQTAQVEKVAAPRVSSALAPGLDSLTGAKKRKNEKRTVVTETKSLGGHVIGGGAAGRMAGWATFKNAPQGAAQQALHHNRQWKGMMAGAAIGGAEFARKRLVEHYRRAKEKNAAVISPGRALRASQQMGKVLPGVRKTLTPPLKTQNAGSTIGRAFRTA